MNKIRASLYVIGSTLLWNFGGVFIKSISLHPLAITFFRSLVGSVIFAVYVQGFRFKVTKFHAIAAVSYAVTSLAFFTANRLTTAANAIILQYTSPIRVGISNFRSFSV